MYIKELLATVLLFDLATSYVINNYNKNAFIEKKKASNLVLIKSKYKETNDGDKPINGHVMFRANSVDEDEMPNNDLNIVSFQQNNPVFDATYSNFDIERRKRSISDDKISNTSIEKPCKNKTNCINDVNEDGGGGNVSQNTKGPFVKLEDLPYVLALVKNNLIPKTEIDQFDEINDIDSPIDLSVVPMNTPDEFVQNKSIAINMSASNHNKRNSIDVQITNKNSIENNIKPDDDLPKNNRDREVYKGEPRPWLEKPSNTVYKYAAHPLKADIQIVNPTSKERTSRINEKGLIKVLSMLTNAFKKVMKQHDDITKLYKKFENRNIKFNQNVSAMISKINDFESKYNFLVEYFNKVPNVQQIISDKEEYFAKKEAELTKNLLDLQTQQRKFLMQQKQFYTVQKILLGQNEKISSRQFLISKTQHDILNRQNIFTRMLKKIKLSHIDQRPKLYKINDTIVLKPKFTVNQVDLTTPMATEANTPLSTSTPQQTESVKINLFSIPIMKKLKNHDAQMLQEKDYKSVDDLVYKFYFNNTFIDSLIRASGLLASIINQPDTPTIFKTALKRSDIAPATIFFREKHNPKSNLSVLRRQRRWVRHHSRRKHAAGGWSNSLIDTNILSIEKKKNDPFVQMATTFCNQLGQNDNVQMLSWCIEKTLRRLKYRDGQFTPPEVKYSIKKELNLKAKSNVANDMNAVTENNPDPSVIVEFVPMADVTPSAHEKKQTVAPTSAITTTTSTPAPISISTVPNALFPDNNALENNLRQYDLTEDDAGNVYFDGSLHASDVVHSREDDAVSDTIPGMDSNSRADLDPAALVLQAKRRESVRKINASILKRIEKGQYKGML